MEASDGLPDLRYPRHPGVEVGGIFVGPSKPTVGASERNVMVAASSGQSSGQSGTVSMRPCDRSGDFFGTDFTCSSSMPDVLDA